MVFNLSSQYLKVASSIAITVVTFGILKIFWSHRKNLKRKAYPKDIVILHQFPPGKKIPNVSPFCLKLETWLRMSDIRYEVIEFFEII